ncbi:MAG: heme exporter protein [Chloroflexota bacterium]|jgi:heme exporter protein A|nr:heme exporter protein [Chloroflexota bacterium]
MSISSASATPLLSARGIMRRFGGALALRGVDLDLHAGECITLLGPNGAGKTTLLRVLATLLRPTAGRIVIAGRDVGHEAAAVRRLIGLVGHLPLLYPDLSARENLRFYGKLYDVPHLSNRVEAVLDEVQMTAAGDRPVRAMSRGMQQRISLARAILHEPPVLLLDEPDTGLDDAAQGRLAGLLRRWAAADRAVLVTTHRLEWGEQVASRAVILREGAVVGEVAADGRAGWLVDGYRALVGEADDPLSRPLSPARGGEGTDVGPA